eukprot:m.19365 g.19365  ORF g.19365 m.19365 type:complete len:705 (+) comp5103_c0_seq1:173-2287(+)
MTTPKRPKLEGNTGVVVLEYRGDGMEYIMHEPSPSMRAFEVIDRVDFREVSKPNFGIYGEEDAGQISKSSEDLKETVKEREDVLKAPENMQRTLTEAITELRRMENILNITTTTPYLDVKQIASRSKPTFHEGARVMLKLDQLKSTSSLLGENIKCMRQWIKDDDVVFKQKTDIINLFRTIRSDGQVFADVSMNHAIASRITPDTNCLLYRIPSKTVGDSQRRGTEKEDMDEIEEKPPVLRTTSTTAAVTTTTPTASKTTSTRTVSARMGVRIPIHIQSPAKICVYVYSTEAEVNTKMLENVILSRKDFFHDTSSGVPDSRMKLSIAAMHVWETSLFKSIVRGMSNSGNRLGDDVVASLCGLNVLKVIVGKRHKLFICQHFGSIIGDDDEEEAEMEKQHEHDMDANEDANITEGGSIKTPIDQPRYDETATLLLKRIHHSLLKRAQNQTLNNFRNPLREEASDTERIVPQTLPVFAAFYSHYFESEDLQNEINEQIPKLSDMFHIKVTQSTPTLQQSYWVVECCVLPASQPTHTLSIRRKATVRGVETVVELCTSSGTVLFSSISSPTVSTTRLRMEKLSFFLNHLKDWLARLCLVALKAHLSNSSISITSSVSRKSSVSCVHDPSSNLCLFSHVVMYLGDNSNKSFVVNLVNMDGKVDVVVTSTNGDERKQCSLRERLKSTAEPALPSREWVDILHTLFSTKL